MAAGINAMNSQGGTAFVPIYAELAIAPPTSATNRPVGAMIFDTAARNLYIATDSTVSSTSTSTTWEIVTNVGGTVKSLAGDSGSAVPNGSGAINILTGPNMTSVASGSTVTMSIDNNITLSGNITAAGGIFSQAANIGGSQLCAAINTDNTNTASDAVLAATAGGTSGGDPRTQYFVQGGATYSAGIDNSTTNDDYVISRSATLGTSNVLSIDGSTNVATFTAGVTSTGGDFTCSNATSGFITGGGAAIVSGTGDPNGSLSLPKGSYYLRLDGSSTSTRAYINTDGGTTWTNVVTAA